MPTLTPARFVDCPGMAGPNGPYYHAMRDGCSSCAPYWERIPVCPAHGTRLRPAPLRPTPVYVPGTAKGWCRECRKHYNIEEAR